jgi:hypothetical protein
VSPAESAARAIEWLQGLVSDLSGLRNATSRDPSFKNWRQNTLTTLQRIWPGDQDRSERFRRIPFSPVDPRADMRAQRESFSRGCQEASRVLSGYIEEIVAVGVPAMVGDGARDSDAGGFEDDFPTVDLPTGDLGSAYPAGMPEDTMHPEPASQGSDPTYTAPRMLHVDMPANAPTNAAHPASVPADGRPARKGLGVAAKLRDLLGLGGFAAKSTPPSGSFQAPPQPSLDIVPVGDEVTTPPPRSAPPVSRPVAWPTPGPSAPAEQAMTPLPPPAPPAVEPPTATGGTPVEPGASVFMSRTTTLRSNIEKVSIESLISPEFRGGAEGAAPDAPPEPTQAITPVDTPAPPTQAKIAAKGANAKRGARPVPPAERPPLSIVPPLSGDPEFNVEPTPASRTSPPPTPRAGSTSKVVPLPLPPGARKAPPPDETTASDAPEETTANVDAEEFARATEDFMRSSPVLGATGRKVKRATNEPTGELSFTDPDAIAVASMMDELTLLGVPTTRQSETRARLVDLARRIESAELEWNALRKAVWFAMEYPEVARRLMPLLLPWIDRAA